MNDIKSINFPPPVADEMVRAILEDRKTVTRRVVKPQPEKEVDKIALERFHKPYRPGDTLYVRETWQHGFRCTYLYRASAGHDLFMTADGKLVSDIPWRPSIHMPREAARIFLRVTDVRVERLRDITEEQAQAEGVKGWMVATDRDWDKNPNYLIAFRNLWDSTIKKADRALYGWEANPWVWVIEFERCGKPKGD